VGVIWGDVEGRTFLIGYRGTGMAFTTGLLIGLFIGVFIGVVILSLLVISRQSDDRSSPPPKKQ
jgi:hypothetical protein